MTGLLYSLCCTPTLIVSSILFETKRKNVFCCGSRPADHVRMVLVVGSHNKKRGPMLLAKKFVAAHKKQQQQQMGEDERTKAVIIGVLNAATDIMMATNDEAQQHIENTSTTLPLPAHYWGPSSIEQT